MCQSLGDRVRAGDRRIGRIQINLADGAQGIIEITELKDLLAGAIARRLLRSIA
ncbi:MAG: hypothetical protein SAK29_28100 [Scytonema sp. PMC 1069.18]|nr:hypothetical protein [Scytonema sp. PMC 1069.18]MEC4881251.1 hypothetical protein [Scytonema sp. PMC 1070.18]